MKVPVIKTKVYSFKEQYPIFYKIMIYRFYYRPNFTFLLLGSDSSYEVHCDVNTRNKKKALIKEYMR
jgi:hypothetical protein